MRASRRFFISNFESQPAQARDAFQSLFKAASHLAVQGLQEHHIIPIDQRPEEVQRKQNSQPPEQRVLEYRGSRIL